MPPPAVGRIQALVSSAVEFAPPNTPRKLSVVEAGSPSIVAGISCHSSPERNATPAVPTARPSCNAVYAPSVARANQFCEA